MLEFFNQGSAVGRDQNGIPVPGSQIPGFDRDRDWLFQIFRDPGRDRDYLPESGIPVKSRFFLRKKFFILNSLILYNNVFMSHMVGENFWRQFSRLPNLMYNRSFDASWRVHFEINTKLDAKIPTSGDKTGNATKTRRLKLSIDPSLDAQW